MDSLLFNLYERLLSDDLNNAQAMIGRVFADTWRAQLATRGFAAGAGVTETVRSVIMGGLQVVPNAANVDVQSGVLAQDSASLAPVPGTYDSTFRLAINRVSTTVIMPAPGVDTAYLIEAQMVRVVAATAVRDIFDPVLETYAPTAVDKVIEWQVQFQVVAGVGTTAPAPSGGNWVPIAIVRRPGGGGPVAASDIVDVRPLWDQLEARVRDTESISLLGRGRRRIRTLHVPGAAVSEQVYLDAEAFLPAGRAWISDANSFDPTDPNYADPGTVFAADTWYYVYLCDWQGLLPVTAYGSAARKGIVVVSDVGPAQGAIRNSAPITPPAPFDVGTVAAGRAICVGALLRNATNDGWEWSAGAGENRFRKTPALAGSSSPMPAALTVNLAGLVPLTAKAALIQYDMAPAGGAVGTAERAFFAPVGGAAYAAPVGDQGVNSSHLGEIPVDVSTSFDVTRVALGSAPNGEIYVIGWAE